MSLGMSGASSVLYILSSYMGSIYGIPSLPPVLTLVIPLPSSAACVCVGGQMRMHSWS